MLVLLGFENEDGVMGWDLGMRRWIYDTDWYTWKFGILGILGI